MAATMQLEPKKNAARMPLVRSRPFWKGMLFRVAAVLLGLLPLIACEATLRLLGLGKPTDFNDPFVGFSDIHPLFVLNEDAGLLHALEETGWRVVGPHRIRHTVAKHGLQS